MSSRVQLKCDGTRWRTGGEVKGKLAIGVGSQYSSHYLGTWCIQHYRRCAQLGCCIRLNWRPRRFKWTRPFRRKTKSGFCACAVTFQLAFTTLTLCWWDWRSYATAHSRYPMLAPVASLMKVGIVSACTCVRQRTIAGYHIATWTHIHNNILTDQYNGFVTLKDFKLPDDGFDWGSETYWSDWSVIN